MKEVGGIDKITPKMLSDEGLYKMATRYEKMGA